MQFWVVEFRDRTGVHDVTVLYRTGILGRDGHLAVFYNALVQLQPDRSIVLFGVHLLGDLFFRLYDTERFRNRHLQDKDLIVAQRHFRDTVT